MKAYDIKGNCTYDGPDELYPPYIEEQALLKDPTAKTWIIYVKGYFGKRFSDVTLSKGFTDIVYGSGQVIYRGTYAQLSIVEDEIFKSGVKVIGSKEYVKEPVEPIS